MKQTFIIRASNEFNAGWLRYVLGLPRPKDEVGADGWDMAAETSALEAARHVFTHQPKDFPQYEVEVVG